MLVVNNLPGEKEKTEIIKGRGFIVVQIPESKNTYTSMALVGITEKEITQQIQTTSILKTIWRELTPIKRAYGNADCAVDELPTTGSLQGMDQYFGSTIAKGAMNCMTSFLQGVWDSTGGMVQSAWEGLKDLVNDPEAFWEKKVQQMKNLGNFIANFDTKVKEMATNIANLPSETKTMLICSFIGSLGTDVALAILTGGAAAAAVIIKMERYISKLMKLEKVMSAIAKIGKIKNMPPAFFKRLSSDKVSDKELQNLELFTKHDMPEVAMGAMSCAL